MAADWELGPTGSKASLRAIAAPTSQVLWIGGSGGTILRSLDGGNSWHDCSPSGYSAVEFRSLHAWDDQRACAASAGTPAVILLTEDGGTNWSMQYKNDAPEAFFDGLKFLDEKYSGAEPVEQSDSDATYGVAISDPVDGNWLIVETRDRGVTWGPVAQSLPAEPKQAAFAASNSAMLIGTGGRVWFGTGGIDSPTSRIHLRLGFDADWTTAECPLPSNASSGVFSLAQSLQKPQMVVAVGGDYRPDAKSELTAAWSDDEGATWHRAELPPAAYRSAVIAVPRGWVNEALESSTALIRSGFICTGPSGCDYSGDGRSWQRLSDVGFHALAATDSDLFAVGSDGRFARLKK